LVWSPISGYITTFSHTTHHIHYILAETSVFLCFSFSDFLSKFWKCKNDNFTFMYRNSYEVALYENWKQCYGFGMFVPGSRIRILPSLILNLGSKKRSRNRIRI
jgi:hypothetical protein